MSADLQKQIKRLKELNKEVQSIADPILKNYQNDTGDEHTEIQDGYGSKFFEKLGPKYINRMLLDRHDIKKDIKVEKSWNYRIFRHKGLGLLGIHEARYEGDVLTEYKKNPIILGNSVDDLIKKLDIMLRDVYRSEDDILEHEDGR